MHEPPPRASSLTRQAADAADWVMTADALALISVDPLVCHGQAGLMGTRIPVSIVLDCLSDGMTAEQIVEQFPSLSIKSIRAEAAYGAELAREELLPLAGDH